jgi:ectoine hydroxylase-related dioxygenase (phytanoyl-CoA dioxygenase family)
MTHEAQGARFARDGYTIFEGALNGTVLELLRKACDDFVMREDRRMDAAGTDSLGISHRGRRYFANECQREQPELRRMLFSATMAEICRATLGGDVWFFLDQFVVKGAEHGMAFSWHQDSGYVVGNGGPADHQPYLTCWCPLDDATMENGTIRVVPGSHRRGLVPHARQPGSSDIAATVSEPGLPIEAKAGDVVAFSSLLLHASGSNRSVGARRVYLAQYTAEPLLETATGRPRRNAIPFMRASRRVAHG